MANRNARRAAAAKGEDIGVGHAFAGDVAEPVIVEHEAAQFSERAYLFSQTEIDAMARGLYYLLGMAAGLGRELPGTVLGAFHKIEAISTQSQQPPQG